MKKLVLFGALALGMLSFTSDKVNEQIVEDGEMDCAVVAWYAATNYCTYNSCTQTDFNIVATFHYENCLEQQQ